MKDKRSDTLQSQFEALLEKLHESSSNNTKYFNKQQLQEIKSYVDRAWEIRQWCNISTSNALSNVFSLNTRRNYCLNGTPDVTKFAKPNVISQHNCKECNPGYYLQLSSRECQRNKPCHCNNGTPVDIKNCHQIANYVKGSSELNQCVSCLNKTHHLVEKDYENDEEKLLNKMLNNKKISKRQVCEENVCTCKHGQAVRNQDCLNHNSTKCIRGKCEVGYHFESKINDDLPLVDVDDCLINECHCLHGKPVQGVKDSCDIISRIFNTINRFAV